jgi:hypothetical protein
MDLCSVADVPQDLSSLVTAEGADGKAARLAAVRCLLVQPQNLLPLNIGFREVIGNLPACKPESTKKCKLPVQKKPTVARLHVFNAVFPAARRCFRECRR